jgi:hypothetical protein
MPVIPALVRMRQENHEFKAAWVMQQDPVSKYEKANKNNNNCKNLPYFPTF